MALPAASGASAALRWRHRPWFPPAVAFAAMMMLTTAIVGGVSYEVADRLIHPPREVRDVDPLDRGIPYESLAFTTRDGVTLVGWWMPARGIADHSSSATVIFLHGYGASKAQSLSVAPFLHRAGYNVLAFDFRAHGESGGTYTTVGLEEAHDVRAAVELVGARADADPARIALLGWSMGAAAMLNAAPSIPHVRAFVADSAFAKLDNVVSNNLEAFTGLPYQPFGTLGILFASWMVQRSVWENEPEAAARALERPLLVIQGMRDPIARPEADGAALAQAAGPFSELWLVPNADHVNARRVEPREYEARVLEFLAAHLEADRSRVG